MMRERADLVVIGGGPGGSTIATFAAMRGRRVILLERERFPRHQIGESLLPATIHGICRMLGLTEEIEGAGFMRKLGGTFRWGKQPEPWTFAFADDPVLGHSGSGYAYQVERARFDHILLDNARRRGVDVREGATVTDVVGGERGERVEGVRYRDEAGREHAIDAAWVVDAGGHSSGHHALCGERLYSKFFQNVALYGYYEGALRLPPPRSGNILSAAFEHGWFWFIPLTDTLTSVGAVVGKQHAERLKGGHEEAMASFIAACPIIRDQLGPARRVTEGMYGRLRVRKDYSYCNTRFWRPGLVLVGDTACFIDPVFSSGVHLATYAALNAARAINAILDGDLPEARCMDEFERRYRREFGVFYDFLLAFYDMQRDEQSYYWAARRVLHTEEAANTAFIRLVAGTSVAGPDFLQARAGSGDGILDFVESAAPGGGRPRVPSTVMHLLREESQLVLQAKLGERRPAERPLFDDGLVPSADGLSWRDPGLPG